MTDPITATSTNPANKTATGTAYEKFVQGIYQTLHDADGFDDIKVEHNKSALGRSGCSHQIDVYWEFKVAGELYKTAIECKAYNTSVSIGRVRDFYGVLADVPNLKGIFVSMFGFQSGATKYATHYGITLKEIREPTEEDKEGRVTNVHLNFYVIEPTITGMKIEPTKAFLDTLGPNETLSLPFEGSTEAPFVVDKSGNHVASVEEIRRQLPTETGAGTGLLHTVPFPECYYNSSSDGPIPIDSVTVRYDVNVDLLEAEFVGNNIAKAIIKDVESGKLTLINNNGEVREVRP